MNFALFVKKCGCNRIDHNGNDLYKNKLIKELGVVIKRVNLYAKMRAHMDYKMQRC